MAEKYLSRFALVCFVALLSLLIFSWTREKYRHQELLLEWVPTGDGQLVSWERYDVSYEELRTKKLALTILNAHSGNDKCCYVLPWVYPRGEVYSKGWYQLNYANPDELTIQEDPQRKVGWVYRYEAWIVSSDYPSKLLHRVSPPRFHYQVFIPSGTSIEKK